MESGEKERNEVLQRRGLGAIDGAMSLMLILLIVQIWLISATLNAYLGGSDGAVLPGAIISGVLFLGCAGLYHFVSGIDTRSGGAPR
jgi:amino acid transporter